MGTGTWELGWDEEMWDSGTRDAGTRRRGTRGRGMRGLGDAWRLGDVINKPDFLICKVQHVPESLSPTSQSPRPGPTFSRSLTSGT